MSRIKAVPRHAGILSAVLALCAGAAAPAAAALKYGPTSRPLAVPLSQDHSYFQDPAHAAPDFWRLSAFYVPQPDPSSCSAASVSMALNSLLAAGRTRGDQDRNVTPERLLADLRGGKNPRLAAMGVDGRHGVTLEQLTAFVEAALSEHGGAGFAVSRHPVRSADAEELRALRAALRLVLVFDVDRDWYEPYWVPDEALLQAMAHSTAAFGRGGYVRAGRRP